MINDRETFAALLLNGVPHGKQAHVHLPPLLLRIESEMQSILQTMSLVSLTGNGILPPVPTVPSLFGLLFEIIRSILGSTSSVDSTVDEVVQLLIDRTTLQNPGSNTSDLKTEFQQLVIAALGWITLLFSWHTSPLLNHCSVSGGPSLERINLHLETCSRPMSSFIRLFGVLPTPYTKGPGTEDLLYLSSINFHSLNHIGRLRIKWVPHLSQHLVFSIHKRTLRLFKYPSICVLQLLGGDYQTLSHRIMHDAQRDSSHSLHREVLLSLRFILGGTRKSRRLARKLALSLLSPEERDATFDMLLAGKLDYLLRSPSLTTPKKALETLAGLDFLTPWADFPLLGSRLLEVQMYNDQQRPTKTRKMIRDKRDPARWYTLWVVLLVGGISVILSVMQLAVACAQLAYAVKADAAAP